MTGTPDRATALRDLAAGIDGRTAQDAAFRHAVGSMAPDLGYIADVITEDPDAWRAHRAFFIIHVPSLDAALRMLPEVDAMTSVTPDERDQINAAFHQGAALAGQTRGKLEQRKVDAVMVELSPIKHHAPGASANYQKPGLMERTLDSARATSETTVQSAMTGASQLWGQVGRLQDSVVGTVSQTVTQAATIPGLADNLRKRLMLTAHDTVMAPIGMRLSAGSRALQHGFGTGVGVGVVVGLLVPPLLPLSAGPAILVAMRTWRKDMEAARALQDQARADRIAELDAERARVLSGLADGAAAMQLETEDLSLDVDAETGEVDAVVLKGQHAGQRWSDLSTVEKADFVSNIAEASSVLIEILWAATGQD